MALKTYTYAILSPPPSQNKSKVQLEGQYPLLPAFHKKYHQTFRYFNIFFIPQTVESEIVLIDDLKKDWKYKSFITFAWG